MAVLFTRSLCFDGEAFVLCGFLFNLSPRAYSTVSLSCTCFALGIPSLPGMEPIVACLGPAPGQKRLSAIAVAVAKLALAVVRFICPQDWKFENASDQSED